MDSASPKRGRAPGAAEGNPAERAEHVRIELQNSIQRVQSNRRQNRRRATIIKIVTILLSGLATILLGLQLGEQTQMFLKQAAFVCGACVTMLSALEPFFNFRSLWIEHERALAALYRIESDLNFYLSGTTAENLDMSIIEDFHERGQGVWDELSSTWLRVRSEPERKRKP